MDPYGTLFIIEPFVPRGSWFPSSIKELKLSFLAHLTPFSFEETNFSIGCWNKYISLSGA